MRTHDPQPTGIGHNTTGRPAVAVQRLKLPFGGRPACDDAPPHADDGRAAAALTADRRSSTGLRPDTKNAARFTHRLWSHSRRLDRLAVVADPDTVQILVGRALRSVRLQHGMTQENLAAACGMHPTYVSDIERGARNPSWKAIVRLAHGLDVPVATIASAFDELAR